MHLIVSAIPKVRVRNLFGILDDASLNHILLQVLARIPGAHCCKLDLMYANHQSCGRYLLLLAAW